MSRRYADWSEIIEGDLDDPGAGFMEGYEFDSGPALREGNPAQNSHVSGSASPGEGVVPGHKPSSSFMNFFKVRNLTSLVGVPDATSIL